MSSQELEILIKDIVAKACELKDKFTHEKNIPVNYACVFSQTQVEYQDLVKSAGQLGRLVKEYPNGLLFALERFETYSGTLPLLKIRQPDTTRPERGDADFTLSDYRAFKHWALPQAGFKLITRPNMEMIELIQPGHDVRVYFSYPTLVEVLQGEGAI